MLTVRKKMEIREAYQEVGTYRRAAESRATTPKTVKRLVEGAKSGQRSCSLVARGLSGVELVISVAHGGIEAAIATVLAYASWQRCGTQFMANLASRVQRGNWPMIAALVRSIFEQSDEEATWSKLGEVIDKVTTAGFNDVAVYLIDAADDILAFGSFATEHWPKIRSNNPQERLNKEIRRRTDVVGIFPNRQAVIRLGGAILAEQTDEWAIAKRYMSAEWLEAGRIHDLPVCDPKPAMEAAAG